MANVLVSRRTTGMLFAVAAFLLLSVQLPTDSFRRPRQLFTVEQATIEVTQIRRDAPSIIEEECAALAAAGRHAGFIAEHRRCRANELIADCLSDRLCMVSRRNFHSSVDPDAVLGFVSAGEVRSSICVRNPYIMTSADPNKTKEERGQLTCDAHVQPSRRPCDKATGSPLDAFKCMSSWLFPYWYDWEGSDVETASSNDSTTRVGYNDKRAFVMDNICITPTRGLFGWNPDVKESYRGQFETRGRHEAGGRAFTDEFLSRITPLQAPPTSFLDTKVLIMPMTGQEVNVGHMAHRVVSAQEQMRIVWGEDALRFNNSKTLVIYVATRQSRAEQGSHFGPQHGFAPLVGALGTGRWASILSESAAGPDLEWWLDTHKRAEINSVRSSFSDLAGAKSMVCFKQVMVWEMCNSCDDGTTPPWEWSVFGRRTDALRITGQHFRRRVAECLSVDLTLRQQANKTAPAIFFALRTKTRFMSDFGFHVETLVEHSRRVANPRALYIAEQFLTPSNDLLRAILDSDIFFGPHGATFTLSFLLPQGAAVLEITTPAFSDPQHARNLETSVIGAAYATAQARNTMFVLSDHARRYRLPHEHLDWEYSSKFLLAVHDKCLESIRDDRPFNDPHGIATFHDHGDLHRIARRDVEDGAGVRLHALFRMYERPPQQPARDALQHFDCLRDFTEDLRRQGQHLRVVEIILKTNVSDGASIADPHFEPGSEGPHSMWRDFAQGYFVSCGYVRVTATVDTYFSERFPPRDQLCAKAVRSWEVLDVNSKCLIIVKQPPDFLSSRILSDKCAASAPTLLLAS